MNVLMVSHLFPNRREPLKGVFVLEYARALARRAQVQVMAPLPAFPLLRPYRRVPATEERMGVCVFHPKYLALPTFGFGWRWWTYYRSTSRLVESRLLALAAPSRGTPPANAKPETPLTPSLSAPPSGEEVAQRAGEESSGAAIGRDERTWPGIVHAHWVYPDAYAALRWARPRGMKLVVTVHGHAAFGWFGPQCQRRYYREALVRADHVIAVSHEIQTKLVNEFGLDAARVTVIHNGVDPAQFPLKPREEARRSLGLPLNKRLLLTVARLSPEKQLDLLIRAANRCRGRHDWQLHIVGIGPLRETLRAQIAALGLENRVLLEGGVPHEQLHDWYAAADVFCLSSLHEGCPVVVLEALACGVPVVSTAVGAVPDFVTGSDYGLLCRNGSVEELGAQIDRALNTHWNNHLIAQYGRRHTWDAVVEETLRVYDAVASQAPGLGGQSAK